VTSGEKKKKIEAKSHNKVRGGNEKPPTDLAKRSVDGVYPPGRRKEEKLPTAKRGGQVCSGGEECVRNGKNHKH